MKFKNEKLEVRIDLTDVAQKNIEELTRNGFPTAGITPTSPTSLTCSVYVIADTLQQAAEKFRKLNEITGL